MHLPTTVPILHLRPLTTLIVWLGRARIRAWLRPRGRLVSRDLESLDDHLLRDIGLL